MPTAVKITSKGQVTIPKNIRDILKSDTVEFDIIDGNVVVKPVKSVGGSLSRYAKEYVPFKNIRDKVWKEAVIDKTRRKKTG